jgi:hypothetical protein
MRFLKKLPLPDLDGEERADSDGQIDEHEEDGGRLIRIMVCGLATTGGWRAQFQQPSVETRGQ